MKKKFVASLSLLASIESNALNIDDLQNEYINEEFSKSNSTYLCEKVYTSFWSGNTKEKVTVQIDLREKWVRVTSTTSHGTKVLYSQEIILIEKISDLEWWIYIQNTHTDSGSRNGKVLLYKLNPLTKVIKSTKFAYGLGHEGGIGDTANCKSED